MTFNLPRTPPSGLYFYNNYLNSCRMEKKSKVDVSDNFNGLVDSFYMPLLLKLLIGIMTVKKYPY